MNLSERIGKSLRIDPQYIEIISKRNNLYAKYSINKKNGGKRKILQPSAELKLLQKWLVINVFNNIPISRYSYAYSKGNSIKKNAQLHRYSRYILHTDIVNFFPTIDRQMVLKVLNENAHCLNLSNQDINLILDICLFKGRCLVVGSVASPRLANIVMYNFDNELNQQLSKVDNFKFSRYADDIVISSMKYIDKEIVDIIEKTMVSYGFTMNKNKTYFMSKKNKRHITGVVIDNNRNRLSIGNKKYKEFERVLYKLLVKRDGDLESIRGYLAHIKEINEEQYKQLEVIYSRYDNEKILFK